MEEEPKIDSTILRMQSGDSFLICSDGFWENIAEPEMCYYAKQQKDPKVWLRQMRNYVETNAADDMDNHSAIAVGLVSKAEA